MPSAIHTSAARSGGTVARATLRACEARNSVGVSGSSTTNTSGVPGGVLAAIRPASVEVRSSSGEMNVWASCQPRTVGAAVRITSTMPTGHAIQPRPMRSASQASPRLASSGMQNANVRTRSGGNQPVRTPAATATSVKASHDTRNRRGNPRPFTAPATSSSVFMIGAYRGQLIRNRSTNVARSASHAPIRRSRASFDVSPAIAAGPSDEAHMPSTAVPTPAPRAATTRSASPVGVAWRCSRSPAQPAVSSRTTEPTIRNSGCISPPPASRIAAPIVPWRDRRVSATAAAMNGAARARFAA